MVRLVLVAVLALAPSWCLEVAPALRPLCRRCAGAFVGVALQVAPALAAAPAEPSPEALEVVQAALEASSAERSDAAALLGRAIASWKREKLASDELAGL